MVQASLRHPGGVGVGVGVSLREHAFEVNGRQIERGGRRKNKWTEDRPK